MVTPFWRDANWIQELCDLAITAPRKFKYTKHLVTEVGTGHPLPELQKLQLVSWRLRARSSRGKGLVENPQPAIEPGWRRILKKLRRERGNPGRYSARIPDYQSLMYL